MWYFLFTVDESCLFFIPFIYIFFISPLQQILFLIIVVVRIKNVFLSPSTYSFNTLGVFFGILWLPFFCSNLLRLAARLSQDAAEDILLMTSSILLHLRYKSSCFDAACFPFLVTSSRVVSTHLERFATVRGILKDVDVLHLL